MSTKLDRVPLILNHLFGVMAGLAPATHAYSRRGRKKDVDARDKRGHDGEKAIPSRRNAL